MDSSNENNMELFKNSEFENINGLFGITRMMIEGNSEKKKNVFPADIARTQGKNRCCKKNKQSSGQKQECTSTRTPYYGWENVTQPSLIETICEL